MSRILVGLFPKVHTIYNDKMKKFLILVLLPLLLYSCITYTSSPFNYPSWIIGNWESENSKSKIVTFTFNHLYSDLLQINTEEVPEDFPINRISHNKEEISYYTRNFSWIENHNAFYRGMDKEVLKLLQIEGMKEVESVSIQRELINHSSPLDTIFYRFVFIKLPNENALLCFISQYDVGNLNPKILSTLELKKKLL